jgi:hypothetical protein
MRTTESEEEGRKCIGKIEMSDLLSCIPTLRRKKKRI